MRINGKYTVKFEEGISIKIVTLLSRVKPSDVYLTWTPVDTKNNICYTVRLLPFYGIHCDSLEVTRNNSERESEVEILVHESELPPITCDKEDYERIENGIQE